MRRHGEGVVEWKVRSAPLICTCDPARTLSARVQPAQHVIRACRSRYPRMSGKLSARYQHTQHVIGACTAR
eukprot:3763734-Rhodomonas_salina.1